MSLLLRFLRDLTRPGRAPGPDGALYLDLLKKCVSNYLYDDDLDLMQGTPAVDPATGKRFFADPVAADPDRKYYGEIWPSRAHTMIGIPRLDNLQYCVETVLNEGIPGDFIEAGVWRGGACIFMRGILKAHGVTDRRVWVADSFEGLPAGSHALDAHANFSQFRDLAISLDQVRANFERYGLLDDQVRFLKGWFRDTLPGAPLTQLAVMRLDGDLYESTMDGLRNLYPKLSPGGFVIIDDYNVVTMCTEAVNDYRRNAGITAELSLLPAAGAFWRK